MILYIYASVLAPQDDAIRFIQTEVERYEKSLKGGMSQKRLELIKKIQKKIGDIETKFRKEPNSFVIGTIFENEENKDNKEKYKKELKLLIAKFKRIEELKSQYSSRSFSGSNEEKLDAAFHTVMEVRLKKEHVEKYDDIGEAYKEFLRKLGEEETTSEATTKEQFIASEIQRITNEEDEKKSIEKEKLEIRLSNAKRAKEKAQQNYETAELELLAATNKEEFQAKKEATELELNAAKEKVTEVETNIGELRQKIQAATNEQLTIKESDKESATEETNTTQQDTPNLIQKLEEKERALIGLKKEARAVEQKLSDIMLQEIPSGNITSLKHTLKNAKDSLEQKTEEEKATQKEYDEFETKKQRELERKIEKRRNEITSGTSSLPRTYASSSSSLKSQASSYWSYKIYELLKQDEKKLKEEKDQWIENVRKWANGIIKDSGDKIQKMFKELSPSEIKILVEKMLFEELFKDVTHERFVTDLGREYNITSSGSRSSYGSSSSYGSPSSSSQQTIGKTLDEEEKRQPINILKIAYNALSSEARHLVDSGKSISSDSLDQLNKLLEGSYNANEKTVVSGDKKLTIEIDYNVLEAALFYEIVKAFRSLPDTRQNYSSQLEKLDSIRKKAFTISAIKSRIDKILEEIRSQIRARLTEDPADSIEDTYNDSVTAIVRKVMKENFEDLELEKNDTHLLTTSYTEWKDKFSNLSFSSDGDPCFRIIKEEDTKSKPDEIKKEQTPETFSIQDIHKSIEGFVKGKESSSPASSGSKIPESSNPLTSIFKN